MLKSIKVTPEETDLIVDLGTPNYEPYAAFAAALAVAALPKLGEKLDIEFPIVTLDIAARRRNLLQRVGEGASDKDKIAIRREVGNLRERFARRCSETTRL